MLTSSAPRLRSREPRPAPGHRRRPVPERRGRCRGRLGVRRPRARARTSAAPRRPRRCSTHRGVRSRPPQVAVTGQTGFGGGQIYYPTDTTQGTFGAVAVVPGFLMPWESMAWLGPRLASHGFVVIGIQTELAARRPAVPRPAAAGRARPRRRRQPREQPHRPQPARRRGLVDGRRRLVPGEPGPPVAQGVDPDRAGALHDPGLLRGARTDRRHRRRERHDRAARRVGGAAVPEHPGRPPRRRTWSSTTAATSSPSSRTTASRR